MVILTRIIKERFNVVDQENKSRIIINEGKRTLERLLEFIEMATMHLQQKGCYEKELTIMVPCYLKTILKSEMSKYFMSQDFLPANMFGVKVEYNSPLNSVFVFSDDLVGRFNDKCYCLEYVLS